MGVSKTEQRFADLIGKTYEAAFTPSLWAQLGPEIAATFGSTSAVVRLALPDPTQGVLVATENLRIRAADIELARHWFIHDLWAERVSGLALGRAVRTQELIDDNILKRTGFYNEWLKPLSIHKCLGCVMDLPDWGQVVIGIHRPEDAKSFDDADTRALASWLPHLHQALVLQATMERVNQREAGLKQIQAASVDAFIVVDANLRVLQANLEGERVLRDETWLRTSNGQLIATGGPIQQQLLLAVQRLARGDVQGACVINFTPATHPWPVVLQVSPLPSGPLLRTQSVALICLRQAERHLVAPEHLMTLFGLSLSESRVVALLSKGLSVPQVAALQNIEPGTVRAHLKNAMTKTGTHRQSELVALACRACMGL